MHWIAVNHKRDGAVSVSVAGKTCRPMDAMTIEPPPTGQTMLTVPAQTLANRIRLRMESNQLRTRTTLRAQGFIRELASFRKMDEGDIG